ncbi:sugar transferase [Tenacibaculum soleae]|uniref:Sugar transferase n=2 Tax=Tenacibaculum TaxID=104267 RepID=A0A1B9XZY7_9FLAO|nr:sugar transferase [Tenacibaculum soleae]
MIKKEKCLFVNLNKSLDKLLTSGKISDKYEVVFHKDLNLQDKAITCYIKESNIKVVVFEKTQLNQLSNKEVNELVNLRLLGIEIYDSENFYECVNKRIPIIKIQDNQYFSDEIFSLNRKRRFTFFKRGFDTLFSLTVLPLVLPLTILGCFLTKISSKGNMFYSQIRIGREGKEFKIYKIRTMENNEGGFTVKNDNRITPVGKFLRLSKIDELPQFYNILMGHMSLIGPRPEQPKYVEEYSKENPFFNLRHMIRPGVSGWAQIHMPKATPEENLKKLEYDLYYIKKYSWKLDVKILFKTVQIVFTMNSN